MNDNQDRTDFIQYRLREFVVGEIGVTAVEPEIEEFVGLPGDTRFGFLPPELRTHDNGDIEIVVTYQPEMLSLLTDTLSDTDFAVFMDALELMISTHITLLVTVPDVNERIIAVENDLHDTNPAVLRLLSDVQFALLGDT